MVFCLVPLSLAGCARTAALPPVICLSGRIAAREDALQMQGLADDLNDREGAEKRLQGQVAPAAAPWSGTGAQVRNRRDLARFAADARARPRAFAARDTARGQAIRLSAARSAALPLMALALLVFSLAYLALGWRIPVPDSSDDSPFSARSFPLALGVLGAVLSAVLLVRPFVSMRDCFVSPVSSRSGWILELVHEAPVSFPWRQGGRLIRL